MAEIDIIHEIEMQLLTLEKLDSPEKECNIILTIQDVGTWILKLRYDGNIFNNRDLILSESIRTDAHLIFAGATCFQQLIKGTLDFEAAFKVDALKFQGNQECLQAFKSRCKRRMDINAIENASLPIRSVRVPKGNDEVPIKSGWLFKKRDIISGWKCRYFEIYKNKLNYYIDQNETVPRGTITLEGAVVHPVKRVTLRRSSHHFGVVIEAKNPDRVLRLASEKTLDDGQTEAESWYQAFLFATQSGSIQPAHSSKQYAVSSNDKNNLSPSKNIKNRRNSFLMIAGDGDEPVSVFTKAKYATIMILVFSSWHYLYSIQQVISWKMYITGIVGLLGLVIVLIVEMSSSSRSNDTVETETVSATRVTTNINTSTTATTALKTISSPSNKNTAVVSSPTSSRHKQPVSMSSPSKKIIVQQQQQNKDEEGLRRVTSYSSLEDYDDGDSD